MADAIIEQEHADERLKEIFRRLMELYERHAQERQLIVKEKEEMNRLIQLLISQTKEVGQYEQGIRKRIQDCIKDATNTAINNLEQSVIAKTSQSVEQVVDQINHIAQSIEKIIATYNGHKAGFAWKVFTAAILSGMLSSILLTWVLIPKPILPLTSDQVSYLHAGQRLVQIWPKLTKQEQANLKRLSYQTMHADT